MAFGQFTYCMRHKLQVDASTALIFMVKDTLVASSTLMSEVYHRHKSDDGIVYVHYMEENTFG